MIDIKKKLKLIKSFSIMIIPDHAGGGAQSRHVYFNKIALYAAIYTALVAFIFSTTFTSPTALAVYVC